MDGVLRALGIYVFLLILFRIAGKRTLAQITTFDLILLLILSETTQQALLGDDRSMLNAVIVMSTLVGADIALSVAKQRWTSLEPRNARGSRAGCHGPGAARLLS